MSESPRAGPRTLTAAPPVVSVAGLGRAYRDGGSERTVLSRLSVEVAEGELLCVVGRSGSGKTTLLNVLGTLDSGFEGQVEIAGRAINGLDDRQLSAMRASVIGFVFQEPCLVDGLDCVGNLTLAAAFTRGESRPAPGVLRERAEELLAAVELDGRRSARPAQLSGGERQRLSLARALFNGPQLLLCDEPTGNLDESTGAEIVELLVRLTRGRGTAVVAATHDRMLMAAADRVLRLHGGRLTADDGGALRP